MVKKGRKQRNKGKTKKIIVCFGSYEEGDNLAFEIYDYLKDKVKNADIEKCMNPFQLAEYMERPRLLIIDAVRGIEKVRLFEGVDEFKKTQSVTIHDLDLGFLMKMLERFREADFKILGVPLGSKKDDVLPDVMEIISSF